jgi:hypothetical protein
VQAGITARKKCNKFLSCTSRGDSGVTLPNDIQLAWTDAEIDVLFHLDMVQFCIDAAAYGGANGIILKIIY